MDTTIMFVCEIEESDMEKGDNANCQYFLLLSPSFLNNSFSRSLKLESQSWCSMPLPHDEIRAGPK